LVDDTSGWSLRSVLISVSNLDRSVPFYEDVMSIREMQRDGQLAILGSDMGSLMLILREASRGTVHSGQQSLGLRTFSCNVTSHAELDRVEERLLARGAFRDRQQIGDAAMFEILRGYDPDRLPMTFVTYDARHAMSADDYLHAMSEMYDVDI
jgi:catechol 2,3-dioxygenase-like lactoylglutathione lyase family enzyme